MRVRLAESATEGFSNVKALHEGLRAVKNRIRAKQVAKHRDEAPASGEGAAAQAGEELGLLAENDCAILLYNLAALHFARKEYGAARAILEHLFRDIEPIDEVSSRLLLRTSH